MFISWKRTSRKREKNTETRYSWKFINLRTFSNAVQQERELLLINGTVDDLRGEADLHQRRIRELEEHIQSDNRAEKLEEALRNTQERADEFEFQLSRLKQASSFPSFSV